MVSLVRGNRVKLLIEPSDRQVSGKSVKTGIDSTGNYRINYTRCFRCCDIQQEVN